MGGLEEHGGGDVEEAGVGVGANVEGEDCGVEFSG